jgi:hypothetical protein
MRDIAAGQANALIASRHSATKKADPGITRDRRALREFQFHE